MREAESRLHFLMIAVASNRAGKKVPRLLFRHNGSR